MTAFLATDFQSWNAACPKGGHAAFHPNPPKSNSIFLFINVTNPMPWNTSSSIWSWFESVDEILGYLLNVAFPDLAATWLNNGLSGLEIPRVDLKETIDAGVEIYPGDKEFFLDLERDLSKLLEVDKDNWYQAIQDQLERFNDRFGSTATYHLTAELHPDMHSAHQFCIERLAGSFSSEAYETILRDTKDAFSKVDSDEEAQLLLAQMFCFDS